MILIGPEAGFRDIHSFHAAVPFEKGIRGSQPIRAPIEIRILGSHNFKDAVAVRIHRCEEIEIWIRTQPVRFIVLPALVGEISIRVKVGISFRAFACESGVKSCRTVLYRMGISFRQMKGKIRIKIIIAIPLRAAKYFGRTAVRYPIDIALIGACPSGDTD